MFEVQVITLVVTPLAFACRQAEPDTSEPVVVAGFSDGEAFDVLRFQVWKILHGLCCQLVEELYAAIIAAARYDKSVGSGVLVACGIVPPTCV